MTRYITYLRLGLAAVALFAVTACGGTTDAPATVQMSNPATYNSTGAAPRTDFVDYQDAEYPFSLYLPREWYMGQLDLDTYALVVASTNDPGQERSAITILVEPASIADGIEPTIEGAEAELRAQSSIRNWKVELARPVTVNTLEGQERWYSYALDGQNIRQRSVYVSDGEQVYAVSLVAPQSLYTQHDTLFNDVITSFKGEPAAASTD